MSRVEPERIYRRTLLGEHGQKREVQSCERRKLRFSEKQRFRRNTREYWDDAPHTLYVHVDLVRFGRQETSSLLVRIYEVEKLTRFNL